MRPVMDPQDFQAELKHAIQFLCEDMKVKVLLRFRGREHMHKEFGVAPIEKFANELTPWGQAEAPLRAVGKAMSVMIAPHPPAERAHNPHIGE